VDRGIETPKCTNVAIIQEEIDERTHAAFVVEDAIEEPVVGSPEFV
jgi:hypothetical protein